MTDGSPPTVGDPLRLLAELDDVSPVEKGRETLGRYILLYELASGGMATLYLAKVSGPGGFTKLVAIKRIHPHLAKQRHFVEMFLDEARIAARLQHPNVGQIFELGEIDRNLFIAMEYIEGESLARVARGYLEQCRLTGAPPQMPIRECAQVVAEAAAGLHAAHELRATDGSPMALVHRDVSPHNILVTYDGYVKLIDFGVAKARGRIAQTTDKLVKGKVAYMSPEQIMAKPLDRRSDLFSLGVVLYEMTCSRRLFKNEADMETLAEIVKAQIRPPSQVIPGYPPALEQVVMKSLARQPDERFQSAEEMRQAILAALQPLGPSVGAPELAALMRTTFEDRIKLKTKLRESCESGVSDATNLLEALGDSDTLDFSVVTAKGQRISQLFAPRPRRRGLMAGVIGAVIAAVVVAATFLLLRPGGSSSDVGVVRVLSSPPGAAVYLDGVGPMGQTPARLEAVAAGAHQLEVRLDGHLRWSEPLEVEGGAQLIVDAALRELPPPPPPDASVAAVDVATEVAVKQKSAPRDRGPASKKPREPGKLALKTVPWSEVYLGDKKLGVTPLIGIPIPAGRHTLKLLPEGKKPATKLRIRVKPGQYLRKEIELR